MSASSPLATGRPYLSCPRLWTNARIALRRPTGSTGGSNRGRDAPIHTQFASRFRSAASAASSTPRWARRRISVIAKRPHRPAFF